jgi:hypothetical protein
MKLRTTPLAAFEEMRDIVRRRDAIPTDLEIANKYGLTRGYVQQLMSRIRKTIGKKAEIPIGTNLTDTPLVVSSISIGDSHAGQT